MAKKQLPPRGPQLEIAGHLAVAFVNTAAARDKNRQQGVRSYADLLTWSQQAAILQAHDAARLAAKAAEDPAAARAAYTGTDTVRGALTRLFIAMQLEKDLPPGDLEIFNQALARALPAARVMPSEQGVTWGFAGDDAALDRMLWSVLFAAAELLIFMRRAGQEKRLPHHLGRQPGQVKTLHNRLTYGAGQAGASTHRVGR